MYQTRVDVCMGGYVRVSVSEIVHDKKYTTKIVQSLLKFIQHEIPHTQMIQDNTLMTKHEPRHKPSNRNYLTHNNRNHLLRNTRNISHNGHKTQCITVHEKTHDISHLIG